MSKRITLMGVNLSYPHVFQKRAAFQGQDPKYSADFLLAADHPQIAEIQQVIAAVTQEAFGPERAAYIPSPLKWGPNENAELAGKGKQPKPEYENHWLIRSSEGESVLLSNEMGQGFLNIESGPEAVQFLGELKARMPSGSVVNAILDVFSYNHPQRSGVTFGLKGVQLVRGSGEGVMNLGGAQALSRDAFGAVPGAAPTPAPVAPAPVAPAPVAPAPVAPAPAAAPDYSDLI